MLLTSVKLIGDYSNGVFTGLPKKKKKSIRQLQLIRSASAHVLTKTKKIEPITSLQSCYTGSLYSKEKTLKHSRKPINHQ